jgi:DNA-binding transcriptional LysR family regulator
MISIDLCYQYYLYMLLAQIAAFVEVARRQSVSRAAEALFVTQPALSARLQRLEADLGASLFVRTSRGMKLTDAGEAFLPYAVRALDALGDGRMQVNALERGGAGHLAIGAAPALSTYVLPGLLKRFAQSHPRVSVSVRTGHSEEILELVLREQVDIGLVRALHHRDIVSIPLYEDRLILVVDPAHPFAGSGRIRLEQIANEQVILFDRTSSYHELTSALFRTAGVSPSGVMELDNIDAAKKMVEQGFGVALLPHTSVAQELSSGTLAEVAIQDAAPVRRQIVAIRRRDAGRPTGTVAALLDTFAAGRAELTEWPPPRAEAPRRARAPGGRSKAPGPVRRR